MENDIREIVQEEVIRYFENKEAEEAKIKKEKEVERRQAHEIESKQNSKMISFSLAGASIFYAFIMSIGMPNKEIYFLTFFVSCFVASIANVIVYKSKMPAEKKLVWFLVPALLYLLSCVLPLFVSLNSLLK